MTKNKKQHFVPAFYLYNFTNDSQKVESENLSRRKTKIHHYDLIKKDFYERPIENIATESYLLSYKNTSGSYDHSLDNKVQKIENKAANSINELNDILKELVKKKASSIELNNSIIPMLGVTPPL